MTRIAKLDAFLQQHEDPARGYKQFTVDWIENARERIEGWRQRKPISEADLLQALEYEANNIWVIIRSHLNDYSFFGELWELLSRLTAAADAKTRRRRIASKAPLN